MAAIATTVSTDLLSVSRGGQQLSLRPIRDDTWFDSVCCLCRSGAVKLDIELDKITIDQCSESVDVFADTHRCLRSTRVSCQHFS